MLDEVIAGLSLESGDSAIDCTTGGGGHARAILIATAPDGRLLALDRDEQALQAASRFLAPFGPRLVAKHASFDRLAAVADEAGFFDVQGVLFDLGISSDQLDDPERGFSFATEGPLDMRLDRNDVTDAATIVNETSADELADILYRYGDETRSRRIAKAIVSHRPIATTRQLAEVVASSAGYHRGRTHPATRTFQAIRIAVNGELDMLSRALPQAVDLLAAHGRIAVISFHSIEDRVVKQAFRALSADCVCPPNLPECRCDAVPQLRVVTRRPLTPSASEVAANPRARSARLRIAERLPDLELAA
jgi:16S rRNA (cytosine1402-N4)-methyltransferase